MLVRDRRSRKTSRKTAIKADPFERNTVLSDARELCESVYSEECTAVHKSLLVEETEVARRRLLFDTYFLSNVQERMSIAQK